MQSVYAGTTESFSNDMLALIHLGALVMLETNGSSLLWQSEGT